MRRRRRRHPWTGFVVVAILGIVAIAGYEAYTRSEPITTANQTRFAMDTTVQIRAIGPNAEEVLEKAFAEIDRVERTFSVFLDTSEISRINANAGEWVSVSQEVLDVVQQGIAYGEITKGTFDISIGPLVALWGFRTGEYRIPPDEKIAAAKELVDYRRIEVDQENRRIRIPPGFALDLGGIAKGYAVDQAGRVFEQNKITQALVNAGGDIVTIGTRPDGNPWRVGIQDPVDTTDMLAVVPLSDRAIVTSGDYQRFFIQDDVHFHHILDTRTGHPARGMRSVTVIADSAIVSDALSTALFVLGDTAGRELVEALPNVEAVLVDQDREIWVSSGIEEVIEF